MWNRPEHQQIKLLLLGNVDSKKACVECLAPSSTSLGYAFTKVDHLDTTINLWDCPSQVDLGSPSATNFLSGVQAILLCPKDAEELGWLLRQANRLLYPVIVASNKTDVIAAVKSDSMWQR